MHQFKYKMETESKEKNIDVTMKYVGFGKRFLAYLIDGIVLSVVMFVINLPLSLLNLGLSFGGENAAAIGSVFTGVISIGISVFVYLLYFSLMESSKNQGTLGKMALNIKVVDEKGNKITFGRAVGRYFGKMLSSFTLGIGYIMIAFTEKKQGLHDLIVKTYVVEK